MSLQSQLQTEKIKKLLNSNVAKTGSQRKTGSQNKTSSSFMRSTGEKDLAAKLEGWVKQTHSLMPDRSLADEKYSSKTHSTMTQDAAAKLLSDKKSFQSIPNRPHEAKELEKRKTLLNQTNNYLQRKDDKSQSKPTTKQPPNLLSIVKTTGIERQQPTAPKKDTSAAPEEKPVVRSQKKIASSSASTKTTIAAKTIWDILTSKNKSDAAVQESSGTQAVQTSSEVGLAGKSPHRTKYDLMAISPQKSFEKPISTDKSSFLSLANYCSSSTVTKNKTADTPAPVQSWLRPRDSLQKTGKLGLRSGVSNRKLAIGYSANCDPLPKIVEEITDHGTIPSEVTNQQLSQRSKELLDLKPRLLAGSQHIGCLNPKGLRLQLASVMQKTEPHSSLSAITSSHKTQVRSQAQKPEYFMSPSKFLSQDSTAHLLHLTTAFEDQQKNHSYLARVQNSISLEGRKVDFPLSSPPKKLMLLLDLDETLIHCDPRGETKRFGSKSFEVEINSYRGVEKVVSA